MSAATEECLAQLHSDVRLQPGTPGWWRVWGQSTLDIQPGDIVITLDDDGELLLREVAETERRLVNQLIVTPEGDRFTFGHLFHKWFLYRRGTKHTLSPHCR